MVRLWDPRLGQELDTLTGHRGTVFALAFSPDGSVLASGSYDETVRFWASGATSAPPTPWTFCKQPAKPGITVQYRKGAFDPGNIPQTARQEMVIRWTWSRLTQRRATRTPEERFRDSLVKSERCIWRVGAWIVSACMARARPSACAVPLDERD